MQSQLGHKTATMTLDQYGHLSAMTSMTWPTKWTILFRGLGEMCPNRKQARAKIRPGLHLLLWSCRESNPGPTAFPRGFSVRSSLCLYSDLLITRTSQDDDPSRCECPDESRDRTHRWIPLADARVRAEGFPGLTDSPSLRQRGRSRADWNRRLIGCNDAYGGLLPAPARFP